MQDSGNKSELEMSSSGGNTRRSNHAAYSIQRTHTQIVSELSGRNECQGQAPPVCVDKIQSVQSCYKTNSSKYEKSRPHFQQK
jgi:hypothetical protein